MIGRRLLLVQLLASMLMAGSAGAQPLTLELSYSNPGARSVGFGGAFVALADDATAAVANPAGLSQLARREISIEGRQWDYSTPFTAGGRLDGVPSGFGLDTELGLQIAESSAQLRGMSFLAFVYPTGDWSFAFYRHQLATFEFSGQVNALFADAPAPEGVDPGFANAVRDHDVLYSFDFETLSYGVAAAYNLTEALRLGLGVSFSEGSMLLIAEEYLPDDDSMESYFAPGAYRPERLLRRDTVTIDDTDWTLNAGFLWSITPQWRLGGSYRRGPDFVLQAEAIAGPAGSFPTGTISSGTALPDAYGLGVSYRSAGGGLTIAFEWDRVEYSRILESLDPSITDPQETTLDDASEFHLGAEYAFLGSTPVIALRVGAWLDPDHRTRAASDEPFSRALLRAGDDEMHYALGFGVAFEKIQIDVAVDLSELRNTASVSAIFSF